MLQAVEGQSALVVAARDCAYGLYFPPEPLHLTLSVPAAPRLRTGSAFCIEVRGTPHSPARLQACDLPPQMFRCGLGSESTRKQDVRVCPGGGDSYAVGSAAGW